MGRITQEKALLFEVRVSNAENARPYGRTE